MEPEKRSKEEILKEYNQLAYQAGDAEYKIKFLSKILPELYSKMDELNHEKPKEQTPDVPLAQETHVGEEHA